MPNPKITVLMAVFNGEKYIKEALKSILNQSYKNFELIIVNDGSTDQTEKIISSFKDKRIKLIFNKKNEGVSKSLNKGLKVAKGKYIARCDADDVNVKSRFLKQVSFLEQNSEYVLVGSNADLINEISKKTGGKKYPESDEELKRVIWIRNQILHPSVIYRTKDVRAVGGYSNFLNGAEDYDLFFKLMKRGKVKNIQGNLVKRRIHSRVVTQTKHTRIEFLAIIVRLKHFSISFFAKKNLDIIVGFFTFLIYKFWLTFLLFQNRLVPPEPDDSYLYLNSAKNLFNTHSFEQFRMVLFSIWLVLIKTIFSTNFEKALMINFYIGVILIFFIVITFIRSLEKEVFNRVILITMMGLYIGSGAYHGFYWVMPSFYLIGLFFLLLRSVFSDSKFNFKLNFLLVFFYIFVHPSSILFLLIFCLNPILNFVFKVKNKTNENRKSIYIFVMGLFLYFIYGLVSRFFSNLGSLNAPTDTLSEIGNLLNGNIVLLSLPIIWHEYFKFILLNVFTITVFGFCLILCFIYKKYKIIIVFLASVILTFIAALNPFGYRVLGLVWPLTFLILGFGIIGMRNVINLVNPKAGTFLAVGLLVCFGILATILNLVWIRSQNVKDNYYWDKSCPSYLNSLQTSNPVLFDSWESYYAFQLYGFAENKGQVVNPQTNILVGDYFVGRDRSQLKIYTPSGVEKILTERITRTEKFPSYQVPNYYWTNIGSDQLKLFDKKLLRDCNYFKIYKLFK